MNLNELNRINNEMFELNRTIDQNEEEIYNNKKYERYEELDELRSKLSKIEKEIKEETVSELFDNSSDTIDEIKDKEKQISDLIEVYNDYKFDDEILLCNLFIKLLNELGYSNLELIKILVVIGIDKVDEYILIGDKNAINYITNDSINYVYSTNKFIRLMSEFIYSNKNGDVVCLPYNNKENKMMFIDYSCSDHNSKNSYNKKVMFNGTDDVASILNKVTIKIMDYKMANDIKKLSGTDVILILTEMLNDEDILLKRKGKNRILKKLFSAFEI